MSTGEFKEEGQPASQSPQDFVCRYFHAGCVFLCVLGDPELLLLLYLPSLSWHVVCTSTSEATIRRARRI